MENRETVKEILGEGGIYVGDLEDTMEATGDLEGVGDVGWADQCMVRSESILERERNSGTEPVSPSPKNPNFQNGTLFGTNDLQKSFNVQLLSFDFLPLYVGHFENFLFFVGATDFGFLLFRAPGFARFAL